MVELPVQAVPDAYSSPVLGSTGEPTELTATIAATVVPDGSTTLADPMPPLKPPEDEPVAAPTTPCSTGPSDADAYATLPSLRVGEPLLVPPRPRSNRIAPGTIGTTCPGPPICQPCPSASRLWTMPSAAASPGADLRRA